MNNIKLFESKQIRSVWNGADQKWYFSIADVIQALTDTINVKDYIKKMRKRDPELNSNWGTFCPPLEMMAPDGKRRKTQCANAENVLRIIQSIPSSKAEPFKRWLARVGYERLEEIENPLPFKIDAVLLFSLENMGSVPHFPRIFPLRTGKYAG